MNSLKAPKIKGFEKQKVLKKRIYNKKKEKRQKKALTKKEVFDSIYLVDGKRADKKDNENRRRSKRQEKDKIKVVKIDKKIE